MKIIAATILVTACATTQPVLSPGEGSTVMPRFGGAYRTDEAKPWFPALATSAALPSAARYQRELSTSADRYALDVRICVAPDGSVGKVELDHSTGSALLDRAAIADIPKWRFEPFTAPANIRVCKQLALAYEPLAEHSVVAIPLVSTSER